MTGAWEVLKAELVTAAVSAGNDPGRAARGVDLAAGNLQAAVRRYGTSERACGCPDRKFRRVRLCKHQIGLATAQRLRRRFTIERTAGK